MRTTFFQTFCVVLTATLLVAGCSGEGSQENINVVDPGTYVGTVNEAVPEEREIYVSLENGKNLELYFTDETELTKDGESVPFSELSQDVKVRVTVGREGNRNIPEKVEIAS